MNIQLVSYNSDYYHDTLLFRYDLLRKPLGLQWSEEDLAGEEHQFHIAAIENGKIIGCVVFKPLNENNVMLRQMAVADEFQGRGIGKHLVEYGIKKMRQKGYRQIVSHVRRSAENFYETLGFQKEGEEFIQATVRTIKMLKEI